MRWVVGSIPDCEPIELLGGLVCLFVVVLFFSLRLLICLLDDAYKRTLAANRKE